MNEIASRLVSLLNEALKLDPIAVRSLILLRVPCNKELAEHPEIQVRSNEDGFSISPLGLLCGISGVREDGYANICAVFATVCPKHGKVESKVGSQCPEGCRETVILGDLEGFQVT